MYPICYWQVSGRYFQPEPAMYSRCFYWFPGPLAPSVKRQVSSKQWSIQSCVASHFSEKITLFFSMVSWIMLVVVKTSCRCFSASASIQQICVVWALHSTSASSTYRRVLEGHQKSFDHSPHPGLKFHDPREETKHDGGTMPNRLRGLVETIVGSFPVEDSHVQQRQQRWIIDLCPIDHPEPLSPADHMGPQLIVKEQVWKDVVPPAMVCSCLVLPLLVDPMKSILGDL